MAVSMVSNGTILSCMVDTEYRVGKVFTNGYLVEWSAWILELIFQQFLVDESH